MQRKNHKRVRIIYLTIAWAAVAMVALPAFAAPSAQDNLLTNGSMEGAYSAQDGIPQLQMPNGWRAWWVEGGGGADWANLRPEWSNSNGAYYPERVQNGQFAMRYFKGWATFTAGAYQSVSVPAGTPLEFTAWGQSWSCENWGGCSNDNNGHIDVWSTTDPQFIHLRIGIDPFGGTDPFSSNIVWSGEAAAADQYAQFRVTAAAQADKVTVFLYASQDYPAENQDAYWDNAVLRTTDGSAVSSGDGNTAAPAASSWVGASVIPTYEPREDGTIIHTVRSGETLGGIAMAYGLESAQVIRDLNNMAAGSSIITRGQELIVGHVEVSATEDGDDAEGAGDAAEEDAAGDDSAASTGGGGGGAAVSPSESGGGGAAAGDSEEGGGSSDVVIPTAQPTAALTTGTICVTYFEDTNRNGTQDTGEPMLAGGQVSLARGGSAVSNYTTDGAPDPYCFTDLAPAMYRVAATAPDGYSFTRQAQEDVNIIAGARLDVVFGVAQGVEVAQPAEPPEAGVTDPSVTPEEDEGDLLDTLKDLSGVIVIGACGLIVGLWAVVRMLRRA
jgi:hypothetical protein